MESVIIRNEVEFRRKLRLLIEDFYLSSGCPAEKLKSCFRENYSRIIKFFNNYPYKVNPKNCNILALCMVLRTCSSKGTIHLFSGENISNSEKAEAYLIYKKYGFSDEEIYSLFQNMIISDDEFHFYYKDKLYIPYESCIENDAFSINIVFFSSESKGDNLTHQIFPISVPKNEITPISECYEYFSGFPNPNKIDFWINLYSLEKYRNLFLDGEDKSDKILLKYEFSSYPLEDSKKYIC